LATPTRSRTSRSISVQSGDRESASATARSTRSRRSAGAVRRACIRTGSGGIVNAAHRSPARQARRSRRCFATTLRRRHCRPRGAWPQPSPEPFATAGSPCNAIQRCAYQSRSGSAIDMAPIFAVARRSAKWRRPGSHGGHGAPLPSLSGPLALSRPPSPSRRHRRRQAGNLSHASAEARPERGRAPPLGGRDVVMLDPSERRCRVVARCHTGAIAGG
jgi:hypothetical protein